MQKIVETRSSLIAILSRILAQSCGAIYPLATYTQAKGLRMFVLVSLIVLLSELLFYFSHGASLYRHSFSGMIFTLVYQGY